MRFTDLTTGNERTVEVPWDDDTVKVRYLPGRLTAELVESVMSARTGSEVSGALASVIVGWDVTDDAGAELEVSEAVLARIPLEFIGSMFQRITKGEQPAGEASSFSDAG